MKSSEIRQSFIDYFLNKEHFKVRSSAVAPLDDPTLLFTNAGMNQFKPIFLDEKEPKSTRVVNSQKCIRVSGKHNDLEEVGLDTYHHTFFEMLGNWSFGDYYKAEAIKWAWDLLTNVWKLEKNRLWATVYNQDNEALELWQTVTDISHDRISKFGKKENFWEMGETGPCGPCSEIHYYIGNDLTKQSAKGVNASDEYWELWNLVFIQFNRSSDGKLSELPKKHIDTGAGLERITAVLQNEVSNYETDLFRPIISVVEKLTGISYASDPVPHQVIADHVRMLTFSIADGVMPSNEGRGYIVRRILRRASRFGRKLNQTKPFIYKLVDIVGDILGDVYPEIVDKKAHIVNVIKAEENSFNKTLDRGLNHFDRVVKNLSTKTIPGDEAFKLYDTYGFPLDLTQLLAREQHLTVDEEGFLSAMEQQKTRAKLSSKFKADSKELQWEIISQNSESKFIGYETLESTSKIMRWSQIDDNYAIVLDKTPFYAESGGQVGDTGVILGDKIDLNVINTQKQHERIIHICEGNIDVASESKTVKCNVNKRRREAIMRNHTATHLLHAALKEVLGEHVHQAGSSVGPENLRFDLTHFEKITNKELTQIESLVNKEIIKNTDATPTIKSFVQAKKEGAEALFGEKYGDEVRVLTIGNFSKELCGGTHVNQTGDIGLFKIVEESSLAAGVRRIVAITGKESIEYIQQQDNILSKLQKTFRSSKSELVERAAQLVDQKKELEKSLKKKNVYNKLDTQKLLKNALTINGKKLIISELSVESINELKVIGDDLLSVLDTGVSILISIIDKKPTAVIVATKNLIKLELKAGDLAKEIGLMMGGGGGGKPHLATAGGRTDIKLKNVMQKIIAFMKEKLENI